MLFFRHGDEFQGAPSFNEKGKPFTTVKHMCGRCGGAGRSDRWAYTGFTCFQCGGAGYTGHDDVPLYTREKLDALNATAAKKAQIKADQYAVAAAEKAKEVEARRADFLSLYGPFLDEAAKFADRNEFIADVVYKAHKNSALSEGQEIALRNAIERIKAFDAQKATSDFIGDIGHRLTFKVEVKRVYTFETAFGVKNIVTMIDASGNTIVSKGSFYSEKGNKYTLSGTIKEHATYRDEKQTVIQRVKVLERGQE